MGILMVCMAVTSLSFGLALSKYSAIAGQGFGAELREAQYKKIQTYSFKNIEKFSTASLITRLTTDITSIQKAVEKVLTPEKIHLKDMNFKVLSEGQKIGSEYKNRKI